MHHGFAIESSYAFDFPLHTGWCGGTIGKINNDSSKQLEDGADVICCARTNKVGSRATKATATSVRRNESCYSRRLGIPTLLLGQYVQACISDLLTWWAVLASVGSSGHLFGICMPYVRTTTRRITRRSDRPQKGYIKY